MVLYDVEAVPGSTKPPAVDDSMRTSTGRRWGVGASAPSLTRASPMPFSGATEGCEFFITEADQTRRVAMNLCRRDMPAIMGLPDPNHNREKAHCSLGHPCSPPVAS